MPQRLTAILNAYARWHGICYYKAARPSTVSHLTKGVSQMSLILNILSASPDFSSIFIEQKSSEDLGFSHSNNLSEIAFGLRGLSKLKGEPRQVLAISQLPYFLSQVELHLTAKGYSVGGWSNILNTNDFFAPLVKSFKGRKLLHYVVCLLSTDLNVASQFTILKPSKLETL